MKPIIAIPAAVILCCVLFCWELLRAVVLGSKATVEPIEEGA